MAASGEIKLFRNGPNSSVLVVFTEDYRVYIVKHLHSVSVKKALVGTLHFVVGQLVWKCDVVQNVKNRLNNGIIYKIYKAP